MNDDPAGGGDALDTLSDQMARLDRVTAQFGRSLSRALAGGIAQGRSFDEILRGLGERLIEISLRAAFKPLESSFGSLVSSLTGGLTGAFTGGSGGLFADLAGAASGASASAAAAAPGFAVTMNITTPDAESFRRSEAQVSAALARAVARGQRGL